MIRVLIAEDMRLLRETLVSLLSLEDDIEVVAELEDGSAILPAVDRLRPDVALLDIELPELDGISAAAEVHRLFPDCRVVILTGLSSPAQLRRGLDARVAGFLVKNAGSQEVVSAIRRVAAGERVVDPQLALAALERPANPLTSREVEVLRLIARGDDPKDVAAALFISYGTVRNYLASISTKVDARNRLDAVRIATEREWI
ncbi:two-component system response regulator DesR [Kitasatospora sp. MAA4]|uniref:response regulator transcription factor n=1 Tax=Kitasatospora sp. MAA4 TaxID=3035093 RepID=UPI002474C335|nr:response regulator transcription factor [Kitasatospora sp. MAA4]MDH6135770.1 two-component system response regulator DesR [Kitasatospora sp. MAA4]